MQLDILVCTIIAQDNAYTYAAEAFAWMLQACCRGLTHQTVQQQAQR